MPWVSRTSGIITGVYARKQPGFADEFLTENSPDWVAFLLSLAKIKASSAINGLRDEKKHLPILSEGEQVDVGTLSSGAMANELFAFDGKNMVIDSVTRAGDTATFVFAKNHHLDTGQKFTPSGADQTEYNNEFLATVAGKKIVTATVLGSPATPATGNITALTTDYPWIDHLNNIVFWSASKFKAIHRDATKYDRDCVQRGRVLKDQVLACATVAEVGAINITTDWPDTGL